MSTPELGLQNLSDPLPTATAAARAEITGALHQGSMWFFWIAGLSMVNTFTLFAGSSWMFLAGLGVTQFVAALGHQLGQVGHIAAVLVNTLGAIAFLLFGVFARRGSKGAFITGMCLYVLDALLLLLLQAWFVIAFHGYVIYRLYQGYSACSEIHAFDEHQQSFSS